MEIKYESFLSSRKATFKTSIIPLIFILNTLNSHSQDVEYLMLEPELNLFISTESRWSFSLGLPNREILLEKIDAETFSENRTKHLEVNQWTSYNCR